MQGGTAGPGSRGAGRASPLYLWREVMQSDPLLGVRARTELNRQRGDACAGDARVLRSLAAVLFDAVVPTPLSRARRQAGEAIPLWVFDADRGACLVSPGDVDLLGEGGSHCIGERLEGGWCVDSQFGDSDRTCAVRWWRPSFVWARGHGSQAGLEFRSGTPLPSGQDKVSRETTADG